ncbi:EAL domain-containing protein [Marinomonas sp. THO17]|uniref:putative bifunctional diguanylate cyclase/phosphodiesterase n=1 Tax=Marinomonas sp. THO17 TaxID=3149048 RepID=UPI00336BE8F5
MSTNAQVEVLSSLSVNWLFVFSPMFILTPLGILLAVFSHYLIQLQASKLAAINEYLEVDPLTGLMSRYKIQQVLAEKVSQNKLEPQWLAIMVLDLDHFKTINEAFGHQVGDKLLVKVAQRLTSVFPDHAELGYFGGDAFLVILSAPEHLSTSCLDDVAKQVIKQISQSYFVDDLTLTIGCSIGIVTFPEFGSDPMTLIKNADMAVYEAKRSGRATHHYYSQAMGQRFVRNVQIETRLRHAIAENLLEMQFQPKVDLLTQQCIGMEALLRWCDEELGQVSPSEFVPIAEQSGIILPLGEWVFEQTLRHIVEWQKQGINVPPIAINCSAEQLKRSDFLPNLKALLERYQVDPRLIEVEVTESILIEDAASCAELLKEISQLGIKLAIDDFGTGYSSLSYLKDLPIDSVKIDQVFIRDITQDKNHQALTKAIINLGHDLGLKVIAEGISHDNQLAMLREMRCDVGQGYLFSKALAAKSMSSDPIIQALSREEVNERE